MPVYNVADYLAETVESILAQTVDFVQNCEIIFVNDGSPDNSEEVCLRYQQQFPNNIKYIKQKNAGPGAARNHGIAEASGKYISLLDSDDKISPTTLAEVDAFFERHYESIDVVAIKQQFFEARTGDHPLNYKFTADKIIDLVQDFDQIQMSVTSAFFKCEALQKHKFKESVGRYAEDSHLLGRILLDKQKLGVLRRPTHFYRKRRDQASSLDSTQTDPFWYLETPKRAWYDLLEYAHRQTGGIPQFIQYMVMYDIQWRIKQDSQAVLTAAQETQYKSLVYGLLPAIDDDVVMRQRQIGATQKIFILSKKYGKSIAAEAEKAGHKYYYQGTEIYDYLKINPYLHIDFITVLGGKMKLEGFFDGLLLDDEALEFKVGGNVYVAEKVDRPHQRITFLGDEVWTVPGFVVTTTIHPGDAVEVRVSGNNHGLPIVTHRFSRLSQSAALGYCIAGGFIIRKLPMKLVVRRFSHFRRAYYELAFWLALAKRLKLRVTLEQQANWQQLRRSGDKFDRRGLRWLLIPAKAAARNVYVIAFRAAYLMAKPFVHRPIWLLSDRIIAAGDSGEILFRYLAGRRDVPANVYFVIDKTSSEYDGLKRYGKVLDYHSLRYKFMFLLADKIISSEATDHVINAFGGRMDDLVDLYNFDFVFLQHGIIKDDISSWLNRYDKNVKLFVTSTGREYESIINGAYGYDPGVVKLTGLPRYDHLDSQPKNKLIIAPTWRQNLAGRVDPKTGERLYNSNFKHSDYFRFYQDLMNDDRLLAAMEQHGFSGEFYLHHSHQQQLRDFSAEHFHIMQPPYDYPRAKREGNLLLTDFSSVAIDFAYLQKPVIYAQFDTEAFFKNHTSRLDYFDYKTDGFGPVVNDYEATVQAILGQLERGCKMDKKYQMRVDTFFTFHDKANSRRVYDAILAMNKRGNTK